MRKPLPWLLATACLLMAATAHAGAGDDWRPTYDLAMRWVNFVILAAVLVKFGRRPLADMLKGRRSEIAHQIENLEGKKAAALEKVAEAEARLDASQERIDAITTRIVAQGEKRQQQLVAEARGESRRLMGDARQRIAGQARRAAGQFRGELVDAAVELAVTRLGEEVSRSDNLRLADDFVDQLTRSS